MENNFSGYSKLRTSSQRSSESCPRKFVRNKNLKFDIRYGIACAIPELCAENTYSCQDSEDTYSNATVSCQESEDKYFDTPVSYSDHNISHNGFLLDKYQSSNFPLIKGSQHQIAVGQEGLCLQSLHNTKGISESCSVHNTKGIPESSFVASSSLKRRWKNKNSKLRKDALASSNSDSVNLFLCLYGKIVHTFDCKCLKIKLWKRCLFPGFHPDQASNSDTTAFDNVYLNNFDEDFCDVDKQVSSLSQGITDDTGIAGSKPNSVTKSIDSRQSCTTKLEVCETAKETIKQFINLEADLEIGEGIIQKYSSNVKNLPFESDTLVTFTAQLKGEVQQVNGPSHCNDLCTTQVDLTQSLYNLADDTLTNNNIKVAQDALESCLVLFDNLLFEINNQLEEQAHYTSESCTEEHSKLNPRAQSTTTMASQGNKNKNLVVRKTVSASPVNNKGEEGSSTFSSSNVTSFETKLSDFSIGQALHTTGQNVINVTNKIEHTQGSPPEFGLELRGLPSDSDAGADDTPGIQRQICNLGTGSSNSSVHIQNSEESSVLLSIHSNPRSSTSQSNHPESAGNNNTLVSGKEQSLAPPAKPPRTFMSQTMGQHSGSSIHNKAQVSSAQNLGHSFSSANQQQLSSSLQRMGSQQFANNFDNDDVNCHTEAHVKLSTASDEDIHFEYLEEQAREQYEEPDILLKNGQNWNTNQSTQKGQSLFFHMNEQMQGQHEGMRPKASKPGIMGQMSIGQPDNWTDQPQTGQNSRKSWLQSGFPGDVQQEGHKQKPGMEQERLMQTTQSRLQDKIIGPMHPHDQMNQIKQNEKGFHENVQNQQGSMAPDHHLTNDCRYGFNQSSDAYFQGKDYTRKSSYSTDREFAQEQLDQKMNNPWFQEMVHNMKELIERKGLIVKDVFPDGNCLFTAVIDQLRVHGNFKYTPSSLRSTAVNYLIENSKQRDGTPLEHFLSNETWEHYLARMSRDGEWGEHIILGAISEVLRCRINVLGGISGKSCTVVQPQYMSDKEEEEREKKRLEMKHGRPLNDSKKADNIISDNQTVDTAMSDKSPSQEEKSSETSQSKTGSKKGLPENCKQSDLPQTGSASLPKQTDINQRKDHTAFPPKQNWDRENEELSQGEELFLGLLGEMHYVSLRKKDWEERLHEKLWARIQKRESQKKGMSDDGSLSDDDMCLPEDSLGTILKENNAVDPFSRVPLVHLNVLFWHLCSSPFIAPPKEPGSRHSNELKKALFDQIGFRALILGNWIEFIETLPKLDIKQCRIPFFVKRIRHCWCPCSFSYQPLMVFCSPVDTKIFEENSVTEDPFCLQTYIMGCKPGFVRLCPIDNSKWDSKLELVDGKLCLQHFDIEDRIKGKVIKCWSELASGKYECSCHIVFHCSWPQVAQEWITRTRATGNRWLYKTVKEITVRAGCHLKAAVCEENPMDKSQWEYCFHLAESYLIMHVVYDKHSRVYRIFKLLAKAHFKEIIENLRDIFRHVFYYVCEQIEPEVFRYKPAVCIIYMISKLIEQLQAGFVPHYFIYKRNLLDEHPKDTIERMLHGFLILRQNLIFYAGLVMEERRLFDTSIANVFETIAESIIKFSNSRDLSVAKIELVPLFIQEIKTLVRCKKYQDGIKVFSLLYTELFDHHSGNSPMVLLQEILADMSVNDRWNFAFYWDHNFENEKLLHLVCRGSDTEPLERLLGPNITKWLGKKLVVLRECTIDSNVIDFVEKFFYILCEEIGNFVAVVSGLEFFLSHVYDGLAHKYKFEHTLQSAFQLADHHCTCTYWKNKLQIAEVYGRLYDPNYALQLAGLYIFLYKADRYLGEYHFQSFIDQFEELCERVCDKTCYKYLYFMSFDCGYTDKADLALIKAESLPGDDTNSSPWIFEFDMEEY